MGVVERAGRVTNSIVQSGVFVAVLRVAVPGFALHVCANKRHSHHSNYSAISSSRPLLPTHFPAPAQAVFLADRNAIPALVGVVFELSDPDSERFVGRTPDSARAAALAFGSALRHLMQGVYGTAA